MDRHELTVKILGGRVPTVQDVANLIDDLAHLDPELVARKGRQLEVRVTVIADSLEVARDYVSRLLQGRRRGWIETWTYG